MTRRRKQVRKGGQKLSILENSLKGQFLFVLNMVCLFQALLFQLYYLAHAITEPNATQ